MEFGYVMFVLLVDIYSALAHMDYTGVTYYSGRILPKPEDIVDGKRLQGHSYKTIVTNDPKKCYSSCIQDCRCKACQMTGKKCELLEEDKTSKPDNFISVSGYVYFDLKQTMVLGNSHVVGCYNGCCRQQRCQNGGTCKEHCQNPKKKFTCECPNGFGGTLCEN